MTDAELQYQELSACCPSAPARSRSRRGQTGSILMMVLAIILMLGLAVGVLLDMSLTSGRVASGLETSTREVHRIDGALERAVNLARNDVDACPGSHTFEIDSVEYEVNCSVEDEVTDGLEEPNPNERTNFREIRLEAESSEALVGVGLVLIVDEVNESEAVGYSITVCDWLLGPSMVTETVRGCAEGAWQ